MAIPEWFFGPAGDLRPLPSPEMDVVNTVQRFGGVHTSLNGGRTVDVLGHRSNFEFSLNYVEPEDYFRLEALYTGVTTGPYYLIDPLRRNLLSREVATARALHPSGRGITPMNGVSLVWQTLSDSPVSWATRGVTMGRLLENPELGAGLRLDMGRRLPVVSGQKFTCSVYAKANEEISVHWTLRFYDSAGNGSSSIADAPYTTLPAGEWTRVTQTFDPSGQLGAVTATPELWYGPDGSATENTSVQFVGFQTELGEVVTEPALGGGLHQVEFDTMDVVSPRYPYQSVDLKLLEV